MAIAKAARKARFEAVFDLIRDELVQHCGNEGLPAEAVEWYRTNLEHNVQGGKLNRGISVVDTVEILKGRALTEEEYVNAAILGWSVELLQAYFLVADDLMDGSITRRGQPCWYRAPNPTIRTAEGTYPPVGLIAVNDAPMLKSAIFQLLKTHFRHESYYADLLELFHDMCYKTEMGQLTDMVTAPAEIIDLGRFSLERYRTIVRFKTAYYSFHLPVALAMYMCHIPETYTIRLSHSPKGETTTIHPYEQALSILVPLGEYFQIQDDFLDFSAPPEVLGKIGTDIVDNKCSWCINTALKLCTPEQRRVLDRNYGRKGDIEAGAEGGEQDVKAEGREHAAGGMCEARVKEVFEAVGLRKVYAEYEQRVYTRLNELIDAIPEEGAIVDKKGQVITEHGGLKRQVFRSFLEKIHGRGH
ncbi:putative FPP GGPP synthase family protein [Lyophyllum shimeji]|uniref:(2E,6E)-farnesyl diphosphate synthase n=1 Tax=Lyophyllum shimeji TaxID=47721 RepID=A0A9P3PQS4_LYOSH|nr:putative FPP GGPP synthase family protein [Lyophyllum shimeji]